MIIGSGLLAKAFNSFKDDDNILIFASGISNSQLTDTAQYAREIELLEKHLQTSKKLIYFSTVSVYDPDLRSTAYILHKLKIESLIKEKATNFIIFRLPIVAGKTSNPHTLTNYLFHRISNEEEIFVFTKACRYILDIDDIEKSLTSAIRDNTFDNRIIDVSTAEAIKMDPLLDIFEEVLNKKTIRVYIDKGGCYTPDTEEFISFAKKLNIEFPPSYIHSIIAKYYSADFINRRPV